jgi:hypothetical protein
MLGKFAVHGHKYHKLYDERLEPARQDLRVLAPLAASLGRALAFSMAVGAIILWPGWSTHQLAVILVVCTVIVV